MNIKQVVIIAVIVTSVIACKPKQPELSGAAPPLPAVTTVNPVAPREFRASWVAAVLNLDWPSADSLEIKDDQQRAVVQQREFIRILDEAQQHRLNALIVQVKPNADALYRSTLLPWSPQLTGVQGKDPGYDPLQFIIKEAHKRNIDIHAWINPYRVSMDLSPATLAALSATAPGGPPSVYVSHPQWIRTANHRLVLDPGIPEARQWIVRIVSEIISQYDVDGIHLDDYFYYESPTSPLDDDSTYRQYGGEFSNKADWRRNNTYLLMKMLANDIRARRPEVRFGVSPAGVWRNKSADPRGSDTQAGIPNYDKAYADTRRWVKEGLVDYIVPQVYWSFDQRTAAYDVVAGWWAQTVRGTPVQLYIGNALYKVGEASPAEPAWRAGNGVSELMNQLRFNQHTPGISGTVLFRHTSLREAQIQPAMAALSAELWPTPALIPPIPGSNRSTAQPPVALTLTQAPGETLLGWQTADTTQETAYYALYQVNQSWPLMPESRLLGTQRNQGGRGAWTVHTAPLTGTARYIITAVDRHHRESSALFFPQ